MAESLYRKSKTEVLQGRKLPGTLRRKAVPFRESIEDAVVCAREHHQTSRERDYRADLLIKLLGDCPASAITPQQIDHELSRVAREREWAPARYNRFKAFVSLAFRLGIENGKVTTNPARFVRRRREDNAVVRWLTAEEETKLHVAIQSEYPNEVPAFDLALHTGMRQSAQYRLRRDCVDLERRQITIPRSKHGGIRYIPLDNTALVALVALRSRSDGDGSVMVSAASGHSYKACHALKTPKEWFMAACEKAGVKDFTWHCLRHTFASRLVMAGVPLRTVQELMGHKTIAVTCRYAHLAPQHQLEAVRHLDGWGRKPTESKTEIGAFEGNRAVEAMPAQVVLQ